MNMRSLFVVVPILLLLVGCGGGGEGDSERAQGPQAQPPPAPAVNPYDRSQTSVPYASRASRSARPSNEPANTDPSGRVAFIGGVNVQRMLTAASRGCTLHRCYPSSLQSVHDGVEVGLVRIRDGVSATELLRYLRADAGFTRGRVERWGSTPPTVRLVSGSSPEDAFDTRMAVRLVNSALPADWQLRFDTSPISREAEFEPGVIKVAFAPRSEWPTEPGPDIVGIAYREYSASGRVTAAAALVDPYRVTGERDRIAVLLHEFLHTLGRGHVEPATFPDTIMHAYGRQGVAEWLVLNRLDEAALHVVHERLRPGQSGNLDFNDLGRWSDISTHVMGRVGYIPGRFDAVLFGAVWQNGNVRPWASAFDPSPPLAIGPRRGSASWSGRLLGLTPSAEAVAGAADITMQLGNLRGTLDFTDLEHWTPHARPGAIGTGAQWGDGDLNYRIAVEGRLFYETGGDAGRVTGAFFGANHEKAGGTLRRHDLAAGFGAERR